MAPFDLYLISDRRLVPSLPETFGAIARAVPPGSVAFQLREKDLGGRALLWLARAVIEQVRPRGAKLFINDRLDVALAAGADGVHLATSSIPGGEAARLPLALGASAHAPEEVAAKEAGFFVFGPVFDTPSKRAFGPPVGEEALARAAALSSRPVFALGGIRLERVPSVMARGAAGVAVISAVLADRDPPAQALALVEAVRRGRRL